MRLEIISDNIGVLLNTGSPHVIKQGDHFDRIFDPKTRTMYNNVLVESCREGETHAIIRWTSRELLTNDDHSWRKVDQSYVHDPDNGYRGDCARASIATILGLALDEVPELDVLRPDSFWGTIDDFFEHCGLSRTYNQSTSRQFGLYLASGGTRRSRTITHMVVMNGEKLFHDPHPDRSGLTHVNHIYTLTATDPSRLLQIKTESLRFWPQPNRLRYLERINADLRDCSEAPV